MTWPEVADTTVKIGLGALIAGGFTFLTTRMGHDRQAQASQAANRRILIEKVLELLNEFERRYIHQKAVFSGFSRLRTDEEKKAAEQEFATLDEAFRFSFEKFVDASGMLLLLGEKEAAGLLQDYRAAANEWYEKSLPALAQMNQKELDGIRERIRVARERLFEALAVAYRRRVV